MLETKIETEKGIKIMLHWALVFLVLGIIASVLHAFGIAAIAMNIAYVLFIIFIILLVIHFVTGKRL